MTVFSAISNSEDTMVKLGSTLLGGDDTFLVSLEDGCVSLDSNRDRLLVKSSLELVRRVRSNIKESTNSYNSISFCICILRSCTPCKDILTQSQGEWSQRR